MKLFKSKDNRKEEKLTKALKSIDEFIETERTRLKEKKNLDITNKRKLQKARENLKEFLDGFNYH